MSASGTEYIECHIMKVKITAFGQEREWVRALALLDEVVQVQFECGSGPVAPPGTSD